MTSLQPYTLISSGGLYESNQTLNSVEQARLDKIELTFNSVLLARRDLIGRLMDRRRNIDEECGYPLPWTTHKNMQPQDWQDLHDYDSIAATVNELMGKEAFQVQFEIYDSEAPDDYTDFEKAVDELGSYLTEEPSHYGGDTLCVIAGILKRAWTESMIGRHGVIMFGFDDVTPGDITGLAQPVKVAKYPDRKLLYIRVFSERLAQVARKDTDINSPRYGKPLTYNITLADPNEYQYTPVTTAGSVTYTREVHFSRILHVCKDDGPDPYYHKPECQDVIKPICNLQKIYGADGEGRWKMGFTSLSFETTNPDVIPNRTEMKSLVEEWERGLTRAWALDGGLTAKSIAPTVVDPTPGIEINLRAISIRKRIPKRKLEGTERGELASGQDDGDWNDQVKGFMTNTLNPRLLIPFFDRLINVGVLPQPKNSPVERRRKQAKLAAKNGNGTTKKVELGEPFRTRPGEIVSPVLANVETPVSRTGFHYTSGTLVENEDTKDGSVKAKTNGVPTQGDTGMIPPPTQSSSPRKTQQKEMGGYYIFWPDISAQTDEQKAAIAAQVITALGTYIEKGVDQVVPVREMLVGIFRGLFSEDEIDMWIEAAEAARAEQATMAHKQQQAQMDIQKKKIDEGLEEDPIKVAQEKRTAETEAYMNKIDQGNPPVGNAENEWDGVTYLVDNYYDPIAPLTNKGKQQLTGGRWITTDEGHHIYLKGGRPVAGNPHVIAKMQGKDKTPKKDEKSQPSSSASGKDKDGTGTKDTKAGVSKPDTTSTSESTKGRSLRKDEIRDLPLTSPPTTPKDANKVGKDEVVRAKTLPERIEMSSKPRSQWTENDVDRMGKPVTKGDLNMCFENARKEYLELKKQGKNPVYVVGELTAYRKGLPKEAGPLVIDHAWVEVDGKVHDPSPFRKDQYNLKNRELLAAEDTWEHALYNPKRYATGKALDNPLDDFPAGTPANEMAALLEHKAGK